MTDDGAPKIVPPDFPKPPESPELKVDLATGTASSKLIGSLAPPLAKHTTPPVPDKPPELNYGTIHQPTKHPVQVEKGTSARIALPSEVSLYKANPEFNLHMGKVSIAVKPISDADLMRKTTEGGSGFAQMRTEKRAGIILDLNGSEIVIEDLTLEDFYDPKSPLPEKLPTEGVDRAVHQLTELKAILNETEHSEAIDKIIQELQSREKKNHQSRQEVKTEAERHLEDATLRVAIGRSKTLNPETGEEEDTLKITPLGLAASSGKVHLLRPIQGAHHKEQVEINEIGLNLIGLNDGVKSVSRQHLILEIKNGQLTLVDGNGESVSSSNGTTVEPITHS